MLIGITGKSGSGKSTIANLFTDFYHIDVDKIVYELHTREEIISKVNEIFPETIEDNKINKKKLSNIVFNDKNKLDTLETIMLPYMVLEIDSLIFKNENCIIDYILLPKTKYFNMCDITILVEIDENIRKNRVLKRDNITEIEYNLRDRNGFNTDKYSYDYIISNDYEALNIIKSLKKLKK